MIFVVLGIVLIVIITVLCCIHIKNKKLVLEKSERLQSLLKLNSTIQFRVIKPRYFFHHTCHSKRQIDYFSLDEYLISLMDSHESSLCYIIDSITFNYREYNNYISKTNSIESTATEDLCQTLGISYEKFIKLEQRLFKRTLLPQPRLDVAVKCQATYTSPKGRNHYWKSDTYNYGNLKRLYDIKKQRDESRWRIEDERAKMTASLRYDIFKRDNFRCKICGSTAQDGVKLHVDHIVPVSKGGKTIPSNLQTLCDRCNLGKSNKM